MNRKSLGKAALSSLLVATTMVGCAGAAFRPTAAAPQTKGDAVKSAAAAERALTKRDAALAVATAEEAVRLDPQNAAYRRTLGRAYVLAGRFASAESALSDAVTLGNTDPSTIVSLALVQTAQGRTDAARSLLASHADTIPAGDYGLAMAMAGDPGEGVRILSEAIHDPSATVRTRQNLAYAYALAGRWKDARMVVDMDLEPLAANKRISDWAQLAEPSLAPLRVAALMGVTISASDPGQPAALALAAPAEPAVQMADAAAPTLVEPAPVETAAAADPAPAVAAPSEPVKLAARPMIQPLPVSAQRAQARQAVRQSAAARVQQVAFVKPVNAGASNWVVQLGAYDTGAIAKEKWMAMTARNSALAAFPVLTSQATVNGKAYHRLAISGFSTHQDAVAACRMIRSRQGQCFVRETAPDATQPRWAAATKGRQFASR